MRWPPEEVGKVPEVYRAFMCILRPVVTTRAPDAVLRIGGIHFGTLYGTLAEEYDYNAEQAREVADNLKRAGLVQEDSHGFFSPTPKGEEFLAALDRNGHPVGRTVPPFPTFSEGDDGAETASLGR